MQEKPFARLNVRGYGGKGITFINLNNVQEIAFQVSDGKLDARIEYVSQSKEHPHTTAFSGRPAQDLLDGLQQYVAFEGSSASEEDEKDNSGQMGVY